MFASTLGRWCRTWIFGACVTCLGFTSVLSGCASSRNDQQAAAPQAMQQSPEANGRPRIANAISAKIARMRNRGSNSSQAAPDAGGDPSQDQVAGQPQVANYGGATVDPAGNAIPPNAGAGSVPNNSHFQAHGAGQPNELNDLAERAGRPNGSRSYAGPDPSSSDAGSTDTAATEELPQPPRKTRRQDTSNSVDGNSLGESEDSSFAANEANPDRLRADRLMERAHTSYREGYAEEALRLASLAAELEKSRRAEYRNGEERPSDLIAWLQSADAKRMAQTNVRQTRSPATDLDRDSIVESLSPDLASKTGTQPTFRRQQDLLRSTGSMILQSQDAESAENESDPVDDMAEVSQGGPKRFRRSKQPIALAADPAALAAAQALAGFKPDSLAAGPDSIDPRIAAVGFTEVPSAPADEADPQVDPGVDTERTRVGAAADRDAASSDTETFGDSESPAMPTLRSTSLTWIGIVGLLSGVFGMIGLKWWQIQERRYFAVKTP